MKCLLALSIFCAIVLSAQTLTLVGPPTVRRGTVVLVNLTLANPPANLAGLQWSLKLPTGFPANTWTSVAGAASNAASKTLYCNSDSTTCLVVGINSNLFGAGVVAIYSIAIPINAVPGPVSLPLSGLMGAALNGDLVPLTEGTVYSFNVLRTCDINGDGACNLQDLLIIIQEMLSGQVTHDQNGDSIMDIRDVQIIAQAGMVVASLLDQQNVPVVTADGQYIRGCFSRFGLRAEVAEQCQSRSVE